MQNPWNNKNNAQIITVIFLKKWKAYQQCPILFELSNMSMKHKEDENVMIS